MRERAEPGTKKRTRAEHTRRTPLGRLDFKGGILILPRGHAANRELERSSPGKCISQIIYSEPSAFRPGKKEFWSKNIGKLGENATMDILGGIHQARRVTG